MAISLREAWLQDTASNDTATVTTGAGTLATDLLVAVGWSDFADLATGFGPPTPGTWAEAETVDLGDDDSKIRAWTRTADAGANEVNLDRIVTEEVGLAVGVLIGADLADPVDDSDNAISAAVTPSVHTAPALAPASTGAYLICAAICEVFGGGGTYTPPGGMDEQVDVDLGGGGFAQATLATELLVSSGDTGARDFVYSTDNVAGGAISLAIRPAGPGLSIASFTSRPNRIWRRPRP